MCGLIGVKNLIDDVPVNQVVRTLYEGQKSRGSDGFGFVGLTKKRISTYRATTEKGIVKYLNENKFDEILFHHRLPTSTDNTIPTTHPFEIKMESIGKKYYFAHNGIINNDDDLWDKHLQLGIDYKSMDKKNGIFNDSESLAWEFCLWLNGMIDKFEARGSVALLCLELDEKNKAQKLFFYRNEANPLKLFRSKQYLMISSEGCGEEVRKNRVYYYDYKDKQIRMFQPLVIKNYFSTTKYSGYRGDAGYGTWGGHNYKHSWEADREYARNHNFNEGKERIWKRVKEEDLFGNIDDTIPVIEYQKHPEPLVSGNSSGAIIDVSDKNNTPPYYDSSDELLLKSIPSLKELLYKKVNEQAMLFLNGFLDDGNALTGLIDEIGDLICECNFYFNNPNRTKKVKDSLLNDITSLMLGC